MRDSFLLDSKELHKRRYSPLALSQSKTISENFFKVFEAKPPL